MGALHAGHISLVHAGKSHGSKIVMSIFVNPTQFAPSEDLSTYPRSLEEDVAKFTEAGGDLVFAPNVETMYPQGFVTTIVPAGPAAAGLEDRFRPTHFAGVATIVAKLFNQCRPDAAIFGEKDYQQLKVLTCLARDLDFDTKIIAAPIMREADGLALSSRNIYLSPDERQRAPALQKALAQCASAIRAGEAFAEALAKAISFAEAAGFVIDYIEARDAETLAPPGNLAEKPVRLLAAARLGRTRLIDNIAV
jgi:pantoate--beta-alanine ligase